MNFAIYDLATGEIGTIQETDLTVEGQAAFALDEIPLDYIFLYYIKGGAPVLRPVSRAALDGDVISFENVHPEAVVTLENAEAEKISIAAQEIKLRDPGFYYVRIDQPFPYPLVLEAFEYA
jgi:hypothetical protein